MYHLRVPQTAEELESYYQFRWEMLRKPLHQPKGSERDAWDAMAHHQMVVDEEGNLVAVGRLYINAENEASIRFMAVHPSVQDKGLGTLMAMTLESVARQEGVKRVTCSARSRASTWPRMRLTRLSARFLSSGECGTITPPYHIGGYTIFY